MRTGVLSRYGYCLAALMLFFSCARSSEEAPVLPPPTHPLSRSLIGYGVVSASYTHVVDIPSQQGISLGYLRRGSVVPVIERRYFSNQGTTESWIMVDENYRGWLKEEVIVIYDHEAQARTAAESMVP